MAGSAISQYHQFVAGVYTAVYIVGDISGAQADSRIDRAASQADPSNPGPIAFSLSAWAQRVIDPERAGVINLLEPIVAGIIGYSIGERLGVLGYLGAALILVGIVVVELGSHPSGHLDADDLDPARIRVPTGLADLEEATDVT